VQINIDSQGESSKTTASHMTEYTPKSETSLQTESLEAIMMSFARNTKEGRYIVVNNILELLKCQHGPRHTSAPEGTIAEL